MESTQFKTLQEGMPLAVAERTILRKISDISRETWEDVAKRVALGNALLCPDSADIEKERAALEAAIGKATLLLSGRHLQHGDKDQPKRPQEVFTNCSTAAASFLMFYLLLNGSGVGRSYDNDLMLVDWDNAPNLRCVLSDTHPDFVWSRHESVRDAKHKYGTGKNVMWHEVEDSREGWAKALELWENLAFEKIHADKLLVLDFSQVRPKGSPIGGMQNRPASGPRELIDAFEKSAKLKGAGLAPWQQTIYVDHYFAECVLVGGARRAARMSTKSWRDKNALDFVTIKRPLEYAGKTGEQIREIQKGGKPQGFLWSSNNSVTVDAEFWSLINGGKGDADLREHAKRVFHAVCEASYFDGTGEPGLINVDRLTQKDEGYKELLSGGYVGSKRFQVNEDTHLYLAKIARKARTKEHAMITNPCVRGDTLIQTSQGEQRIDSLVGREVEVWNGYEWSKVTPAITGRDQSMVTVTLHDGRSLTCTHAHQWLVSESKRVDAVSLLPGQRVWQPLGWASVKSVVPAGTDAEVYCFTESKRHLGTFNGIVTGQCGEISLTVVGGFCVIADVVPYHADTLDEAEQVFRTATRALIRVNLMDSIYSKEVKRTNRIGVGITGVHEFAWKFFGLGFRDLIDEEKSREFWLTLARFNRAVREEAESYSKHLGVALPHTMTTIKPAGTTSKLFMLTEGWHLPSMREFLRWVQFRADDPLVKDYQKRGYPVRELKTYSGTTIVGFPTAPAITQIGMGDKLVTAAEATPEEQYRWLMLGEKYWIDGVTTAGKPVADSYGNQISYTMKYDPKTVSFSAFRDMLREYQSRIKCCSVMPQEDSTAYEYQPEQPISSEEYQRLLGAVKQAKEDVGLEHVSCAGGACPIDFRAAA